MKPEQNDKEEQGQNCTVTVSLSEKTVMAHTIDSVNLKIDRRYLMILHDALSSNKDNMRQNTNNVKANIDYYLAIDNILDKLNLALFTEQIKETI